jgi:general stress protein 26
MKNETTPAHDRNLSGNAAADKIREIAKHARSCLFGTFTGARRLEVRPMAVQEVDGSGNLWFLSGRTSEKNRDIEKDPRVQLLFANNDKVEFMSLEGTATIHTDRALKEKYWSPIAKTWFEQGVDDPELTVLQVQPTDGHYWDTVNGKTVTLLKIAVGAVTGKNSGVGVSGDLRVS